MLDRFGVRKLKSDSYLIYLAVERSPELSADTTTREISSKFPVGLGV